jgi:hypothetical protein
MIIKTEGGGELLIEPGVKCTVSGRGDLMMVRADGHLIGKDCVIVKRCKSGLIQVALEDNPKYMRSIPQSNVEPR